MLFTVHPPNNYELQYVSWRFGKRHRQSPPSEQSPPQGAGARLTGHQRAIRPQPRTEQKPEPRNEQKPDRKSTTIQSVKASWKRRTTSTRNRLRVATQRNATQAQRNATQRAQVILLARKAARAGGIAENAVKHAQRAKSNRPAARPPSRDMDGSRQQHRKAMVP